MTTISREAFVEQMNVKYQLQEKPGLIDDLCKACNFRKEKDKFSDQDIKFFEEAKELYDSGVKDLQELAEKMKALKSEKRQKKSSLNGNENGNDSSQLLSEIEDLQDVNLQLAAETGLKQAEIFAKVVQEFTIKRLNEMIKTGEMNQGLRQIWESSTKLVGKPQILQEKINVLWQNRQAQIASSKVTQITDGQENEDEEDISQETNAKQNTETDTNSQLP